MKVVGIRLFYIILIISARLPNNCPSNKSGLDLAIVDQNARAIHRRGNNIKGDPGNHFFLVLQDQGSAGMTRNDYARNSLQSYHQQVGTCKMGRDEMSVVDHELKVHGIEGLRVIDASIMPVVPTGNTNAPTYMVAEKGADMIKAARQG